MACTPHMCGNIIKTGIVELLLQAEASGIILNSAIQDVVLDIRFSENGGELKLKTFICHMAPGIKVSNFRTL